MDIKIKELRKSYGAEDVFKSLTIDVPEGSLLTLLGINGAGKTTMLRMLAGLSGRDGGDILFDGESARRDDLSQRRKLCFLPDFPFFFEGKSLLENICVFLKLWECPLPEHKHILDLIEEFDLLKQATKPIQALSRGQRYKAAFIALVIIDPELWLLDEPFASGMDPRGISAFKRYSLDATQRGKTVIYSTQLVELARSFSSQIWILGNGSIIDQGTAEDIDWNSEKLQEIC